VFLEPPPFHHLRLGAHLGREKGDHPHSLPIEIAVEVGTGPDAFQPSQIFSHEYVIGDGYSSVAVQDVHEGEHAHDAFVLRAKPQCFFEGLELVDGGIGQVYPAGESSERDKGEVTDLGKSAIVGLVQQSQLRVLRPILRVVPDCPLYCQRLSGILLCLESSIGCFLGRRASIIVAGRCVAVDFAIAETEKKKAESD
jgi:hypothetical protein